jgi:hypothetical protein
MTDCKLDLTTSHTYPWEDTGSPVVGAQGPVSTHQTCEGCYCKNCMVNLLSLSGVQHGGCSYTCISWDVLQTCIAQVSALSSGMADNSLRLYLHTGYRSLGGIKAPTCVWPTAS